MRSLILVLFLALIAAGCKQNPAIRLANAGPATVPAGWKILENKEQGISVAAPGGWAIGSPQSMDLPSLGGLGDSGGDMQAFADRMAAQQEKDDLEAAKALEEKGIFLSVINKGVRAIPGEERTRFYVKRVDGEGNMAAADVEKAMKAETPSASALKEVQLPVGKAWRCDSTVTLRDGGVVHRVTYGIPDRQKIYVLCFVTEEAGTTIDLIEKQVAESLRIRASAS